MKDAQAQTDRVAASPDVQVATGITRRHSRGCNSRLAQRCSCKPTYQAQAWSAHDKKPVRKTFKTLAAARTWRQDAIVALRRREMNAPSDAVLADAACSWVEAARSGMIRTRSGQPYKPSALRSYEAALRLTLLPAFGNRRLSAITAMSNALQLGGAMSPFSHISARQAQARAKSEARADRADRTHELNKGLLQLLSDAEVDPDVIEGAIGLVMAVMGHGEEADNVHA